MQARKFFNQTVVVTVLSEIETPQWDSLSDLDYLITNGHCSAKVDVTEEIEIDAKTMAKLLIEQNSDPEFFRLDENGNDLDEEA